MTFAILDHVSPGDLIIIVAALAYGLYAWRIGVPRVLREQNKDLRERNESLEAENKEYLIKTMELRDRVVVLESRVHELEAKGTEQIYNLILQQGDTLQTSIDSLNVVLSRIAVSPSGKVEVSIEEEKEE